MRNINNKVINSLKFKKLFFFFSVIALVFTSACSMLQKPDEGSSKRGFSFGGNTKEIKIYFTKSSGPEDVFFVPVQRKILKEDSIVYGALKELFLGPEKREELRGIMTEIPVGTRLIKVEESEDEVLVDVSSQYLTGGGSASMQMRYLQIYKTLKRIVPQKKLYLHVEGKNIKTIGGEGLEITQPLTKINDYTEKYEKAKEP